MSSPLYAARRPARGADLGVALATVSLVMALAGCSSAPAASSSTEPSPSAPVKTIPATATAIPEESSLPTLNPSPSDADTAAWTEPVLISRRDLSYASVAVDGNGSVHLAVAAGEGARDRGVWYLTNKSGTWTETQVAQPPAEYVEGYDVEPSLAVNDDGTVWIAFTRWRCRPLGCPSEGIFYVTNRDGAWSEPELLDGPNRADPDLTMRNGRIHLSSIGLCNFTPDDCNWPVYYGTDTGGAWRSMIALQESSSGRALIDVDRSGSPRIMAAGWEKPASIEVARLTGDAFVLDRVWREAAVAHPTEATPLLLGTTAEATDVAVWSCYCAQDGVFETARTGGQWSDPRILIPDVDGTDAALGPDGVLHIVGVGGYPGGDETSYYFYASSQSNFLPLRTLASAVGTDKYGNSLFQYATSVALDAAGRPHIAFIYVGSERESGLWYVAGPVS